jgi:hypothetical protein
VCHSGWLCFRQCPRPGKFCHTPTMCQHCLPQIWVSVVGLASTSTHPSCPCKIPSGLVVHAQKPNRSQILPGCGSMGSRRSLGGWPCFHLNPPKLDRCSICAAKSKRGHTGVGWHGKQYVLGQYVALSTPIHVPSESRTEVSQSGLSCFNLNPPKLAVMHYPLRFGA